MWHHNKAEAITWVWQLVTLGDGGVKSPQNLCDIINMINGSHLKEDENVWKVSIIFNILYGSEKQVNIRSLNYKECF